MFVRKLTFDDAVEIFYILLFLCIEMNTLLLKLVIWLVVVQQHILCVPYLLLRQFI